MTHKRCNYLEWPDYFMSIAFLSAQRSKDPSTQVGACIVNEQKKVVGIGYNGMPIGCSDDSMPWNKAADASQEKWLRSKLPYVCHAELNAVMNKNSSTVKDCILYVVLFPCNMCAQIIIQSGIKEIVYFCDKYPDKSQTKAAKLLLDMAGIKYWQYKPKKAKIDIDFTLIEETASAVPTLPSHNNFSDDDNTTFDSNRLITPATQETTNGGEEMENNNDGLTKKRSNYLEWEEYFMSMAFLSAQRSKDPRTQVGACIVNSEKKIVGIGYNGMPIGCDDNDMPWNRAADSSDASWLNSKSPYVCHAELNAVLNKNTADIKGCTIYVALFPCNMCAQVVIQSGITDVVYYSDKYHHKPEFHASRRMLSMAGVTFRQFQPKFKQLVMDFDTCLVEEEKQDLSSLTTNGISSVTTNGKCLLDACPVEEEKQDLSPVVTNGKSLSNHCGSAVGSNTRNNNNIGRSEKSTVLDAQHGVLDNLEEVLPNNLVVNTLAGGPSHGVGWVNEVEDLPTFYYSIFIASVMVFFSWYAGNFDFSMSAFI